MLNLLKAIGGLSGDIANDAEQKNGTKSGENGYTAQNDGAKDERERRQGLGNSAGVEDNEERLSYTYALLQRHEQISNRVKSKRR